MSKAQFKASELRIGNWVFNKDANEPTEIYPFGILKLCEQQTLKTIESYSPILLTEEWLLKFGFRKHKKGFSIGIADYGYVINFLDWRKDWTFGIEYYDPLDDGMIGDVFNFNGTGLQFVHQLQNLYFTLTGEEFKIKEHAAI